MSRIIGVLNYKGGTGKTTTVVNLAVGLALRGARVLCIDLDAQSGLATYFGTKYRHSLVDLLLNRADLQTCITPVRDKLDLIPCDNSLIQAESTLWRMRDENMAYRVMVDKMKPLAGYDYVIIDHSPSLSLLSMSSLLYVRELIVPVAMNYMALIGTRQVIETLKTVSQVPDHQLRLSLIVPTFYFERYRKDREVMETLQRHFSGKVADPIRANVKLAEAPSYQMSIYEYAARSSGAIDYARLVERVVNNGASSKES
jgi:chromosome partitioning protein